MIPDYTELYKPYTKDGATVEGSIMWLLKTCKIDQDVADLVVAETMMEILNGKDFSGECPCCGMSRAHTRIEHYMRDKAWQFQAELKKAVSDKFQEREKTRILAHIQADNKAYTEAKMKPRWYSRVWKKLNEPL